MGGSHITITRMLVVLFLLPALTAAVPSPHPCRLVDAIPFFNFDKERSSIEDNNDLTILTEFARFMNHKVPAMLEEFANLKNILNIGPVENFQPGKDQTAANLRMPKNLQFEIGSLFDMADGLTREQQLQQQPPHQKHQMMSLLTSKNPSRRLLTKLLNQRRTWSTLSNQNLSQ